MRLVLWWQEKLFTMKDLENRYGERVMCGYTSSLGDICFLILTSSYCLQPLLAVKIN